MDITTAINSSVALQVVISGDEEFLISTGKNPCFPMYGRLQIIRFEAQIDGISNDQIRIQPIGFIEDDNGLSSADILLNDETIYVKPFVYQPVWVEAKISKDVLPGRYDGSIKLYSHRMFEAEELIMN